MHPFFPRRQSHPAVPSPRVARALVPATPTPLVWQVLAPAIDARDPQLLANLFATLPARGPVALEFAATPERLQLLARAWDGQTARGLAHSLYAALPQARLVPVAPAEDPAIPPGEGTGQAVELTLREREIYSLRTVTRAPDDPESDPLAVLVRALQGQQPHERCLLRLTLQPAPAGWQRPYRAWQRDVDPSHSVRRWPTSANETIATQSHELFLGGMLLVLLGLYGFQLVRGRPALLGWLLAAPLPVQLGLGLAVLALVIGLLLAGSWLLRRLLGLSGGTLIPNQPLLDSKLGASGCLARIQLWCWGPEVTSVERQLARIGAALRQYDRPDGNALIMRPSRGRPDTGPVRLRRRHLGLFGRAPVLSATELAGLWGPVGGPTDTGDLTRVGSRRRRPPRFAPDGQPWLVDGQRLGVSEQGGISRRIAFPRELQQRVTAIFGSTGSGKSNLLALLTLAAMGSPDQAVVLFDSHSRLVRQILGLVPPARAEEVIVIRLGDPTHTVSLNLLDVTTGRPPDRIIADALAALQRLWPFSWGDRMEQMFRGALAILVSANQKLPPSEQFTIFQVHDLFLKPAFRRRLQQLLAPEREHERFWSEFYDTRDRQLQQDMPNPVLTKIAELYQQPTARRILGQPQSSIQLIQALREHRIILVDLAQGVVGADLANIVGALIMAHLHMAIIGQAELTASEQARGLVLFDEFETLPAIDYPAIITQLRKFGFGFVFATQSPEALARSNPVLLAQVRDNCQALFAFRTSAEAAALLTDSLDGLVTPLDVANLPTGACYAKLEERQQRIPTFSLQTDEAPAGDDRLARHLIALSRARDAVPVESADWAVQELDRVVGELALWLAASEEVAPPLRRRPRQRPRAEAESTEDHAARSGPADEGAGAARTVKPGDADDGSEPARLGDEGAGDRRRSRRGRPQRQRGQQGDYGEEPDDRERRSQRMPER